MYSRIFYVSFLSISQVDAELQIWFQVIDQKGDL